MLMALQIQQKIIQNNPEGIGSMGLVGQVNNGLQMQGGAIH